MNRVRLLAVSGIPLVALLVGVLALREKGLTSDADPRAYGVLVMAHGGTQEWNRSVLEGLGPLAYAQPLEVAFGMADAASLQTAVTRLEARGVRRIAVVRVFISGESWHERTRQILGLAPGAPPRPASHGAAAAPTDAHSDHVSTAAHGPHRMEFWRLESESSFAVSVQGLSEEPSMGRVLAERACDQSRSPEEEDVLVLAHGPADDAENERWLARMKTLADGIRCERPFRRVEVMTLREDWPEKRAAAEQRIRGFVTRARAESGHAIVVPFRVQGFGPYGDVLKGLDYRADGRGLLPHPAVTEWVRGHVERLRAGPFERQLSLAESLPSASGEAEGKGPGNAQGN